MPKHLRSPADRSSADIDPGLKRRGSNRPIGARVVASLLMAIALVLDASPLSAEPDPRSEDIVVVARKLREWRAVLIVGRADAITCRAIRPSGDAAMDAKGCDEMQRCYAAEVPRFMAARTSAGPARKRLLKAAQLELDTCFKRVEARVSSSPIEGQTESPAAR